MIVERKEEEDGGKVMVNNRAKMQRTNSKIVAWLRLHGYNNIYFFPHSRFSKDYHISRSGIIADFDGIATRANSIAFIQCKTNHRATKKTLREYKALESIFGIECLWINSIDRIGLQINNEPVETFLITTHQETA